MVDNFSNSKLPILFLLYVPDKSDNYSIKGAIRLQKMIFILKEEYKIRRGTFTSIKFIPHKYGMYSKDVQDNIMFLNNLGLIDISKKDDFYFNNLIGEEDFNCKIEYNLTEKGEEVVKKIIEKIQDEGTENDKSKLNKILDACQKVKCKFNSARLINILRYLYKKYPKYTENSEILNKILQ